MTEILILHIMIDIASVIFIYFTIVKYSKKVIQQQNKQNDLQQIKYDDILKQMETYYIFSKLDKSCFLGVGGGGSNVIEDISQLDNRHKFIHINSDTQALKKKTSQYKIILGQDKNSGFGCGGNPKCGEKLVDGDFKSSLYKLIKDEKKVYVISSLGGGIGSGVTPKLLSYLKTLQKEIVFVAIIPFEFEGQKRVKLAYSVLENIKEIVNDVIIIQNDDFLKENIDKDGIRKLFNSISTFIYRAIVKQQKRS